ncbi:MULTISPECIES: hypothetical protein [Pseudomonas]|uniref:Uncharacterized protein n=1 Tax=Pseudomonas wuhanensis TaxID=2954098 RepID=A0ABY9GXN8_9PSED|nr:MULTISPECIES: hypothetical protein [unclassified Pseudomonas]WLI14341.1 hypothetical protein PSH65_09560 [Pseudomonas sp. FP603]WLI20257.1 hypothetical protein PSH88_09580 [Pseudomonas sp. FP607]
MAKPQDDSAVQDLAAATSSTLTASTTTFRDTLYTSRTLILPDDRVLAVAKGVIAVSATDDVALKYLKAHAEFEPLKE